MNTLSIVSGILLLFCFVQGNAQNTLTTRSNSPENILSIQKGQVDNFKAQLYRYETAMEDLDAGNLDAMHQVLIGLMKEECNSTQNEYCDYHDGLLDINSVIEEKSIAYSSLEESGIQDIYDLFSNFYDTMLKDWNCLKTRTEN